MKATVAAVALAVAPMFMPQGAAPAPPTAAAARVVTLSMQRLTQEATEMKAANERLQQAAQKAAGEVNAREKDPRTTAEEMQKIRQQAQNEFAAQQRQVQADLRTRLNPILTELAAQHGADVVINADTGVVWSSSRVDITSEVAARLNAVPPK